MYAVASATKGSTSCVHSTDPASATEDELRLALICRLFSTHSLTNHEPLTLPSLPFYYITHNLSQTFFEY